MLFEGLQGGTYVKLQTYCLWNRIMRVRIPIKPTTDKTFESGKTLFVFCSIKSLMQMILSSLRIPSDGLSFDCLKVLQCHKMLRTPTISILGTIIRFIWNLIDLWANLPLMISAIQTLF